MTCFTMVPCTAPWQLSHACQEPQGCPSHRDRLWAASKGDGRRSSSASKRAAAADAAAEAHAELLDKVWGLRFRVSRVFASGCYRLLDFTTSVCLWSLAGLQWTEVSLRLSASPTAAHAL